MIKKIITISFLLFLLFNLITPNLTAQTLSQGFTSSTFPPGGWSLTPGLWSRYNVSGFCSGSGSAQAYFYSVMSGTYALTSPVFTATGAGDSLIFQDAYASYSGENDQLQVMFSTNGGASFTQLVMLNGGTSGELVTAPPTTSPFVPACNQWRYQRRVLPQGTNRLRFNGISAYGNNLYIDSIYVRNAPPLSELCEGYNSASFPPFGWSIIFTGTNYWLRNNVSGFGVGTGCAEFNSWNAPAATTQSLVTKSFLSSLLGDSLNFDIAYAPYPLKPPYYPDSLYLFASTDNGMTYATISRLGPIEMQTAPPQTTEFTPNPDQWGRRIYRVPVGTNKIQITAYSGFGNNIYIDSVCVSGHLVGIINNHNSTPTVYSLAQNYPNPFNAKTEIRIQAPLSPPEGEKQISLIIFDALGKEIETLVPSLRGGQEGLGTYVVTWDARNYPSGVYYYKLVAGEYTQTKKMVLIK